VTGAPASCPPLSSAVRYRPISYAHVPVPIAGFAGTVRTMPAAGAAVGRQLLALAEEGQNPALQAEGHLRIGTSLVSTSGSSTSSRPRRRSTPGDMALVGSSRGKPRSDAAYDVGVRPVAPRRRGSSASARGAGDRKRGARQSAVHTRLRALPRRTAEPRGSAWGAVHELATEVLEIAERHDYHVWKATALTLNGVALTALGRHEDGIAASDRGIALYQEMAAPPVFWPLMLWLRARTLAQAGRPEDGLEAVDQAMALMRGPPNLLAPQFPVLRGDLLASLRDTEEAEASYRQAIDLTRRSGARMSEIQATIALVRLVTETEKEDARERLRDVYRAFTEGFDEPDLAEARALLGK
jgi:tetratricopeptide (TPR) repeat protein